jgi:outer membrane protein assembly factor BamB
MRRVGAAQGLLLAAPLATPATSPSGRGWPQFGGPHRDFRVETSGLQPWGPEGPTTLWERDLGEGYSGIASDGDVLYTMYRPSAWLGLSTRDEEVVVAIDAATGDTLWEQRNPVEARPSMNLEQGLLPWLSTSPARSRSSTLHPTR